jgi:hypothetical protein
MKEQILELHAQGKSYNEIVRILGCSKGSVSYHCGNGQKEKAYNRVKRYRAGEKSEKPPKKVCKNCKCHIKGKNIYCSKECETIFKTEDTLFRFENGKLISNVTIKKVLISKFGEHCSICTQSSIWNNISLCLQVDHIDGDSDNNLPNNLRLVCPNCHSQLSTSKDKSRKESKRNSYLREYKGY